MQTLELAIDSKPGPQLSDAVELLQVHDHVCLIYDTREEQLAAAVPFIRSGLLLGEKCLYIVDENSSASVSEAMISAGVDIDTALRSGAFAILTRQQTYLEQGRFDPDRMIRVLHQAVSLAKKEGYPALRIMAEMTWVLGGEPSTDRLIEYEAKLNLFFPEHDILAICQYSRRRFSPDIIMKVISTHPLLVSGGLVCRNFYYLPPEEFLKPDQGSLQVDRLIANIVERERAEGLLRDSESRFSGGRHR